MLDSTNKKLPMTSKIIYTIRHEQVYGIFSGPDIPIFGKNLRK